MARIIKQFKKNQFHWPILGHGQIKEYLQTAIINNSLAHAYLFHGPNNTGKFLQAVYLTSTLLCQSKSDKKPCQNCTTCRQIEKNIHTDVTIVKKEADKNNISIEQIREIQHKLSLHSFLTDYKIAIIDNAELMSEKASNALLKTLEEPHPNTILILVTENNELLPSTIVSRCQTLQFNLIPTYRIENWLITLGKTKQDAKIIAHFANGRPGLATSLMTNKTLIDERGERINKLLSIIKGNLNERFNTVESLIDKKQTNDTNDKIRKILDDWLYFFRDVLLIKNNNSNITNIILRDTINILAKNYNAKHIVKIINQIISSKKLLQQSVNPRLMLENLALNM